jgi:hypothetical protein
VTGNGYIPFISFVQKIHAYDSQPGDFFGYSVSASEDYVIVGARSEDGGQGDPLISAGAAYIFHRTSTNVWDSGAKITAFDAQEEDLFGHSVSITKDYVIVGAFQEDRGPGDPVPNTGAAYIFE